MQLLITDFVSTKYKEQAADEHYENEPPVLKKLKKQVQDYNKNYQKELKLINNIQAKLKQLETQYLKLIPFTQQVYINQIELKNEQLINRNNFITEDLAKDKKNYEKIPIFKLDLKHNSEYKIPDFEREIMETAIEKYNGLEDQKSLENILKKVNKVTLPPLLSADHLLRMNGLSQNLNEEEDEYEKLMKTNAWGFP